jgi:hypothetical protein
MTGGVRVGVHDCLSKKSKVKLKKVEVSRNSGREGDLVNHVEMLHGKFREPCVVIKVALSSLIRPRVSLV